MDDWQTRTPTAPRAASAGSAIVELRRYTLVPGQRDVLIELFEREFIEGQEVEGMVIIDQFRDLDNPDRFVWLRGFPNMDSRARALERFYGGAIWEAHSDDANATMIDSDDVLLLRPVLPESGLTEDGERPPAGSTSVPGGMIIAAICFIDPASQEEFISYFEQAVAPELQACGVEITGSYVTEPSPNNYPRLPVREGEHVFVWFEWFADLADYERHVELLSRSPRWTDEVLPELVARLDKPMEVLRLTPTARSRKRP